MQVRAFLSRHVRLYEVYLRKDATTRGLLPYAELARGRWDKVYTWYVEISCGVR